MIKEFESNNKFNWKRENITGLRMERQCLTCPADEQEYIALYRDTQPGQNVYWHGFGRPPVLSLRAGFDDEEFNRRRQADRLLVKGRFQGGNLGWIEAGDMELFACMCRKPMERFTAAQEEILLLIEREGPMNIQQMKEETGMLVKEITPVLHRLQEAFLIYEDQYDGEWDRGWYRFSEMFPEADFQKYTRTEALKIVLQRFAYRMVWFDVNMAKSFYKLPLKEIKTAVSELVAERILAEYEKGFLLVSDLERLEAGSIPKPEMLLILHRNDILVKAEEHWLKAKYQYPGAEVLQYILIDGEIHGAVFGKFKYGPYIIENIALDEEYRGRMEQAVCEVLKENPGSEYLKGCQD